MGEYSIGEVCTFLDVKPYVLRYWEQEVPMISPRKDQAGRRVYTNSDLQILYRIRYLLYEKRFTIEGARKKIWEDINNGNLDIKARIHRLRSDLIEISYTVRKSMEHIQSLLPRDENQ